MIQLLAYIFYFVAATASPLQRRWLAVKREGGGQIDFAFRVVLITAIAGTITLPLLARPELAGSPWLITSLGFICGLFGAGYFVTMYAAQRHVDAGITTLVNNIYTPVTILLAILFLNEALTMLQLAGTMLLLAATVIVGKKHRLGAFTFDRYFVLMGLSGVLLGVCLTAERALMKTTGFTTGVLVSWWAQCLVLAVAALYTKNRTTYDLRDTVATGGLRFLQSLSWVVLLAAVGNLSLVASVTTFKVVVIFVAAAVLLKEREDLVRKLLGSMVAVIGLLLMK